MTSEGEIRQLTVGLSELLKQTATRSKHIPMQCAPIYSVYVIEMSRNSTFGVLSQRDMVQFSVCTRYTLFISLRCHGTLLCELFPVRPGGNFCVCTQYTLFTSLRCQGTPLVGTRSKAWPRAIFSVCTISGQVRCTISILPLFASSDNIILLIRIIIFIFEAIPCQNDQYLKE